MKVYVTKWVLARGILHVQVIGRPFQINQSEATFVHVKVNGWRRGFPLKIGKDCFLSLKDAEGDAYGRFERDYEKKLRELGRAKSAWLKVQSGKGPVVHRSPTVLSKCHAFKSGVSSFLGPGTD